MIPLEAVPITWNLKALANIENQDESKLEVITSARRLFESSGRKILRKWVRRSERNADSLQSFFKELALEGLVGSGNILII